MPKAKRSKVWLHFTSKDADSATCNRCLKAISCKGASVGLTGQIEETPRPSPAGVVVDITDDDDSSLSSSGK
ncbi:Hypothetical protein SMAX5B_004622 [Scophthalmus maximus]|uniref:Uncharacterized protein n=1 Tax=Scophthalmus maximus TaxID=52904 RepID=A0A2U9CMW4_SCOMX|nr:Hypothetical protein SMAX5B_004622 [Scophthalmus maximus]